MIREELLHPAVSHFPIAFLSMLMLTKTAQFFVTEKYDEIKKYLYIISKFLLIVGASLLLPSLFLGDMALDVVKQDLCKITQAYQHEDLAHYTLIVFIIAIVFDTLLDIEKIPAKFHKVLKALVLLSIFLGNYYLFQTAHMGGDLVYEQGAAVKRTMGPCPKNL